MAITKGYRFPISFDDAFPQGLVMVGAVMPDTEYQTRDEKAAGRPVRQRVDELTGKRQWKITVTDPHEPNAKRKSFEITLLADVQPVPTTGEVLPGMRPIELEGLTAEPRIAGTGNSSTGPSCSVRPDSGRRASPRVRPLLGARAATMWPRQREPWQSFRSS